MQGSAAVFELRKELLGALRAQAEAGEQRASAAAEAAATAAARAAVAREAAAAATEEDLGALRESVRTEGAAREAVEAELRRTARQVEALTEVARVQQQETLSVHHTLSASIENTWAALKEASAEVCGTLAIQRSGPQRRDRRRRWSGTAACARFSLRAHRLRFHNPPLNRRAVSARRGFQCGRSSLSVSHTRTS
jgi:hypothetical protein